MPNPSTRRVGYSSLVYDKAASRYRGENGRFLSPQSVRTVIIDGDIKQRAERMKPLADRLAKSGDVAAFRDRMRDEVKALHLAYGAAGKGGLHNMDNAAYGAIGQRLRYHYEALNNFTQEIALGNYTSKDGTLDAEAIKSRIALYAEAGRNTYERLYAKENEDAGRPFVESILEPNAEHCTGRNSCVAMKELGRVKVKDMLMPGDRTCGPRCQCGLRYFPNAAPVSS